MKTILYIVFAASILAFAACEKDETRATIKDNPISPVFVTPLTNTAITMTKADSSKTLLFVWTNPDYGFKAAPSFTVQADVENGTFKKPQKVPSSVLFTDSLAVTYKTFNALVVNKLSIKAPNSGVIQVRVISVLGSDTLFSDVIKLTITPYDPKAK